MGSLRAFNAVALLPRAPFELNAIEENETICLRHHGEIAKPWQISRLHNRNVTHRACQLWSLLVNGKANATAAIVIAVVRHPESAPATDHGTVFDHLAVESIWRGVDTRTRVVAYPRKAVERFGITHAIRVALACEPHAPDLTVFHDHRTRKRVFGRSRVVDTNMPLPLPSKTVVGFRRTNMVARQVRIYPTGASDEIETPTRFRFHHIRRSVEEWLDVHALEDWRARPALKSRPAVNAEGEACEQ